MYQQVTIKGFGTDFNLEEMKNCGGKKRLKRGHQTTHLIPLKASAQSLKWLCEKKKKNLKKNPGVGVCNYLEVMFEFFFV